MTGMPRVTLGVYRMTHRTTVHAVEHALSVGYRSVDTAAYYRNEAAVGEALRNSGLPRDEVFVTSKIWNSDQGERAADALYRSLDRMGLDYLDSYLLHWPVPGRFVRTWQQLQPAREAGLVRNLGVSNFLPRHLRALDESGTGYSPLVNQIEMHPYLLQKRTRDYNAQHGVDTSSWSPLGNGLVLRDPTLRRIGDEHGKSAAQVAIRWALQKDVLVIPKASSAAHINENIDVFGFDLTPAQMNAIDALDRDLHTDWNPEDQE